MLVNGLKYEGAVNDLASFQAFVIQAAGESFNESSTPTPTPTPSPTSGGGSGTGGGKPGESLARTGVSGVEQVLLASLGLLAVGGALMLWARRRDQEGASEGEA